MSDIPRTDFQLDFLSTPLTPYRTQWWATLEKSLHTLDIKGVEDALENGAYSRQDGPILAAFLDGLSKTNFSSKLKMKTIKVQKISALLIKAGVNVLRRDFVMAPLFLDNVDLFGAMSRQALDAKIKSPATRGSSDRSMLHILCAERDPSSRLIAQSLTDGWDPNAVDGQGLTPALCLWQSVVSENALADWSKRWPITCSMFMRGARFDQPDRTGQTAFDLIDKLRQDHQMDTVMSSEDKSVYAKIKSEEDRRVLKQTMPKLEDQAICSTRKM